MGCTASTQTGSGLTREELKEQSKRRKAEKKTNTIITKQMKSDEKAEQQLAAKKILFLGPGGSGKSTIFKQIQEIYGSGFDEQDRAFYAGTIRFNMVKTMQELIASTQLPQHLEAAAQTMMEADIIPSERCRRFHGIAQDMQQLWDSREIKLAYQQTEKVKYCRDSYFFDDLKRIAGRDWLPSTQDIFHCRTKTTGITKTEFTKDGSLFVCFDVGGQRNERKKWIHCFEKVTTVLFVAAIDAFDMVLEEDLTTNGLVEALTLFKFVANLQWFKKSGLVLFLNKIDVFQDKLGNGDPGSNKARLKEFFPDYNGPEIYEPAAMWIKEQFKLRTEREFYVHFTCATSTASINKVFADVRDYVIRQALIMAGMLV